MTRNHIFRSLPVQCRTVRNLIINWQETDSTDVETMIRFFEFEKLTLNVRGFVLGEDDSIPSPEEFQENFSRICALVDPANSKLNFAFGSLAILSSCFPNVLRTILGFRAVVGMIITLQDDVDQHFSQCLRVLTEHGEHLERLDMSVIDHAQDDEICKVLASFSRWQYLAADFYPTQAIAEAVEAHPNLLQFDFYLSCGDDSDKILADRARDIIETSLHRNQANRFARRISSRTTCSKTGAGLKLWPTILSNVDKGNAAVMSGVFQAFRNDMGHLLLGGEMVQQGTQSPPSDKMAGRKRGREKETEE